MFRPLEPFGDGLNAPWAFQKQSCGPFPSSGQGQLGEACYRTLDFTGSARIMELGPLFAEENLLPAERTARTKPEMTLTQRTSPCGGFFAPKTEHASGNSHDMYNTCCVVKRMNVVVNVEISNPSARGSSSPIGLNRINPQMSVCTVRVKLPAITLVTPPQSLTQ